MKISLQTKINKCEALFLLVDESFTKKNYKLFDKKLLAEIEKQRKDKNFKGEKNEIFQVPSLVKTAKKMFLVGMGKLEKIEDCREVAGSVIRKAKKMKLSQLTIVCPKNVCVKRVISGSILGNYEFKIGEQKIFSPKKVELVCDEKLTQKEIKQETALAEATNTTRDLINLPANMMTPKLLATEAKNVAKGVRNPVKVSVLGEKRMKTLKMESLLNVGVGSDEESQLIVFEYRGGKKNEAPVALIGKGVCFDSGGYNIKPTGHIEEMKSDMSGAATVLGIFKYLSVARPKKNVVGVIGAVENLVNGGAYKPGDIITAMNGKTIEITNTDAEGRLVLADCLHYAYTKFKPSVMVDIATLTGACIAALGNRISGVVGNDKKALQQIKSSAEMSDEMVWEMPLTDYFREKTKGGISDLVNWTEGVSAGCSMGGAFLEKFVSKTPWVHIDIAGTAFWAKEETPISKKGATGVMLRTLRHFLEN